MVIPTSKCEERYYIQSLALLHVPVPFSFYVINIEITISIIVDMHISIIVDMYISIIVDMHRCLFLGPYMHACSYLVDTIRIEVGDIPRGGGWWEGLTDVPTRQAL